jgi:predicted nucleic acid-binding protein
MAIRNKTVVFDSSGLISLVKPDDQLHQEAVRITKILVDNGCRLLLPYEVAAESLNTIGKLVNKYSASIVGDSLLEQYAAQELVFIQSEPHIVAAALQQLKHAPGSPSYIDCLVMAFADEFKTPLIFGFDAAFKKNGYRLPTA